MHIFSESSLEKQSKIGSWQRTLPSSSSAPLLSVHLMLLAQKQNANASEAGKSLLFSLSAHQMLPPPLPKPALHSASIPTPVQAARG